MKPDKIFEIFTIVFSIPLAISIPKIEVIGINTINEPRQIYLDGHQKKNSPMYDIIITKLDDIAKNNSNSDPIFG